MHAVIDVILYFDKNIVARSRKLFIFIFELIQKVSTFQDKDQTYSG